MSRWLLAPVEHRCEIWKSYKVQRIVVDAPDEGEARQQVAKRAALSGSTPNPWLDPALISCEKVDEISRRASGHEGMNSSVRHGAAEEFPRPGAGAKRGDLKPAHPRWSSEEESARAVLLRPLVWTVGFLEIPVGKHLEQLRGDRLVEHILAAADQRFVEVDM